MADKDGSRDGLPGGTLGVKTLSEKIPKKIPRNEKKKFQPWKITSR